MNYKKAFLCLSAIILFCGSIFASYEIAHANAVKIIYKSADDFVKGMTKSIGAKKGVQLDINDFLKPDGSIDWVEYDKQVDMLSNIFYKGVQDGVTESKKELAKVFKGETDVIKKTPLKNMPGWSKVLISTGAAITGADLLFDIYQFATSGSTNEFETLDGKMTTLIPNDGSGVAMSGTQLIGGTGADFSAYTAKYGISNVYQVNNWSNEVFDIDIIRYKAGSGDTGTGVFVNKANYSYVPSWHMTFVNKTMSNVIVSPNMKGDRVNIVMQDAFRPDYWFYVSSNNTAKENESILFKENSYSQQGSIYGYSLSAVAMGLTQRLGYYITNIKATPQAMTVVPTVTETVPQLKPTGQSNIGKGTGGEVLIVPEGLTSEQIQKQITETPDIMRDPETFLKENPKVDPTPGENELDPEGPSCKKDLEMPELEALGDTLKESFPFSIPFALLGFIDAAFGGMGSERPSFTYALTMQGEAYSFDIGVPAFFDNWKPFTDAVLILIFDIGILYAIYRFVGR